MKMDTRLNLGENSSLNSDVLELLLNNKKLTESAKPLLMMLLEDVASSGFHNRKTTLSADDYMQLFGLESRETAIEQLERDIDVLFSISINYSDERSEIITWVMDEYRFDSNGDIDVAFSRPFVDFCRNPQEL